MSSPWLPRTSSAVESERPPTHTSNIAAAPTHGAHNRTRNGRVRASPSTISSPNSKTMHCQTDPSESPVDTASAAEVTPPPVGPRYGQCPCYLFIAPFLSVELLS